MRLVRLIFTVESSQLPWCKRKDGGSEGPSGEKKTPGRSRPLELCSTEDHDYHLPNEAADT